ncbi:unnamed protein product [marine sediment metagenome]|uniref:Uncharacterized protein n=1 Tax=marine sediment metagenome TaxID=412755 RepID=X0W9H2_9ZZZZ
MSDDEDTGRDEAGRFTTGCPGGPGRTRDEQTAAARLKRLLAENVSDDDLVSIIRAVVERAQAGDEQMVKVLFDRLAGRPHQAIEVDAEVHGGESAELPDDYGEFCRWRGMQRLGKAGGDDDNHA